MLIPIRTPESVIPPQGGTMPAIAQITAPAPSSPFTAPHAHDAFAPAAEKETTVTLRFGENRFFTMKHRAFGSLSRHRHGC